MEAAERPTLVLLSGGSEVGQSFLQTLGHRRADFRLIATNSRASEPSLLDFDEVHLVPETANDPAQLEAVVRSIVSAADVALIIPCRDDDVVFSAELAERDPGLKRRLICGTAELARIMHNVDQSFQFSVQHGLPFAASVSLATADALQRISDEIPLPLIVKPRAGFASRAVRIVTEMSQVTALVPDPDLVVQEYLGDPTRVRDFAAAVGAGSVPLFHSLEESKISLQTLIDTDGGFEEIFAGRHVMNGGVSVVIDVDRSRDAIELGAHCAEVFAREGWRGPLNIQCIRRPDGRLGIHEYNGRFTGATAARARLGYDQVQSALARFAGIRIETLFAPGAETPVQRMFVSRSMPKHIADHLTSTKLQRAESWPHSSDL